jgi:hypothetical protein
MDERVKRGALDQTLVWARTPPCMRASLSLCPRKAATHGAALYREWFTLPAVYLAAFVSDTDFV